MGTYEEKYKDLVKRLNKAREEKGVYTFNSVLDAVAPELKIKESEDERIRKEIISMSNTLGRKDWIAWLEKQGEQKPKFRIGDTIKKKSTGDIVTICEIDLKNREYRLSNTGFIPFKCEYLWELVEQKSAEWSEEDERLFQIIIDILDKEEHKGHLSHTDLIACVRKLKSLRPQSTWKPSEEQMKTLNEVINYCANGKEAYLNDYIYNRLIDLRDELNKL